MRTHTLQSSLRAGSTTVEELVEQVQGGLVRVPTFQRPVRWRSAQVRDLFDSIWHNYPVGTLLFWKRQGPAEASRLGRLELTAPERPDALYVVDGQQRIAALANVLLHSAPSQSSADIWALWFDLVHERVLTASDVVAGAAAAVGGPPLLPLNVVLDAVALQTWCTSMGLVDDPALFRRALAVGKRVRQFVLPIYTVETDDEQVLQRIFARLNTAGAPMRQHEVFTALSHRADAVDPLDRARRVFAEAGLGTGVSDQLLLQCIRVGLGEDLSAKLSLDAPMAAAGSFEAPLRRALDTLRDLMGVPHHRLLPARWPLLALVRLHTLHPHLEPRVAVLLQRWFWRAIVNRKAVDMDNARLHWLHAHITADLGASLRALLADAGAVGAAEIEEMARAALAAPDRTANAVEVRVGLVILAAQRPRDAISGDELDLAAVIDEGGSAAYGRAPAEAGPHRWRLIHPRQPGLVAALNQAPPEVARSHVWVNDDPNGQGRAAALEALWVHTLRAWCGVGQSDHLPLSLAFAGLEGEE
jgi:hypothetical protein